MVLKHVENAQREPFCCAVLFHIDAVIIFRECDAENAIFAISVATNNCWEINAIVEAVFVLNLPATE